MPFFATLVLLDVIISPSLSSFYEAFADLTLLFGFLPNAGNISVIGVGWFLGLIFVFYLIFPFFCVCLENKRRAWFVFAISLALQYACIHYFHVGRSNILYSASFFVIGGLIYLYKDKLMQLKSAMFFGVTLCCVLLYYLIGGNVYMNLILSGALLIYAVIKTGGVLENRVTKFFSGISMEIYLSHMVIFRMVEKLGLHQRMGNGVLQYLVTVIVVIAGASVFSVVMQKIIGKSIKIICVKKHAIRKF